MHGLQILGIVLIGVGVVLLVLGIQSARTFGEEVRQEFTGSYSDATVWYIVGGVIAALLGVGLAIFGGRLTPHHPPRTAH